MATAFCLTMSIERHTRSGQGRSGSYQVVSGRYIDSTQPKHQSSNTLRAVVSIVHSDTDTLGVPMIIRTFRVPACFREVSVFLMVIEPIGKWRVRQ